MLALEGKQQTSGYQFTRIPFGLTALGYVNQLIVDKTENLDVTWTRFCSIIGHEGCL